MSQNKKIKLENPILKGFHPDPSVVKTEMGYYLATSTFEWYPGVRIYHSKDLIRWDYITSPLDTTQLLDLKGVDASGGIWAPCLSYANGMFYLVYTVVHSHKNYPFKDTPNYLTMSHKIEGPWSKPSYLNSTGFDPSLFHDPSGKKWLLTMQWDYRKQEGGRQFTGIMIQELHDHKLVGKARRIYQGTSLLFTEGPHLYYHNGYYYLICAEGGTSYQHAVTMARCQTVDGDYVTHPDNPILTSYEEGKQYQNDKMDQYYEHSDHLMKAGHASLLETDKGRNYLFHLCARPISGTNRCILGRETAVQEVVWSEDGWLRLKEGGNQPNQIFYVDSEFAEESKQRGALETETIYEFYDETFKKDFQTLRIPFDSKTMSIRKRKGYLRLVGRESIYSRFYQTLLARRQTDFTFFASTCFEFCPKSFQHMAGLIYRYDENNQYYLFVSFDPEKECNTLNVASVVAGKYELMEQQYIHKDYYEIGLFVEDNIAQFCVKEDDRWMGFGDDFDNSNLSDDFTYGFTGAFVGICVQDLLSQKVYADFKNFCYAGYDNRTKEPIQILK